MSVLLLLLQILNLIIIFWNVMLFGTGTPAFFSDEPGAATFQLPSRLRNLVAPPETPISNYKTTCHHILEDCILNIHCQQNLNLTY